MRIASLVWLLVAILVGAFAVDFAQRVTSSDIVAVSFAEGGDDAYYFFTVARNIAQGHGITIDGTPVIDIKPVMRGFAPRGELREPDWAREIMSGYW